MGLCRGSGLDCRLVSAHRRHQVSTLHLSHPGNRDLFLVVPYPIVYVPKVVAGRTYLGHLAF